LKKLSRVEVERYCNPNPNPIDHDVDFG
jgi:hypothetical protein